ncbi:putative 26S proteasome regulatory subunit rpn3 [Neolecta irregularis DAH-3]|uniref:26S proteasome regulatory subunit RPN3 n=1 Tax=Neolecta irregularis (strain DAH-3) TaxID=1198029 RepID=A0A1U7LHT6_NEOID|nr:putative 26S proteasome regulatory subunit rpn3 [Neolecta irregularis DAH-3]|eukprot:OLL22215.1 putative 26S proteasome regulatory subunit rpn3 [Neolecta irregularis DAH-3]
MVGKRSLRSSSKGDGKNTAQEIRESRKKTSKDSTALAVQKEEPNDEVMAIDEPILEPNKEDDGLDIKAEVQRNVDLLERAASTFDPRYTLRVLRGLVELRKHLNEQNLGQTIQEFSPNAEGLLKNLSKTTSMDVDGTTKDILPEVDIYLYILAQLFYLDTKDLEQGVILSNQAIEKIRAYNRRSLDALAAKVYFYYARFYELAGKLPEIRPTLLAAHRTSTLRNDVESQAMILNLLLRNYISTLSYTQADLLVSKTIFPEHASSNLHARHLYYLGRIRAIQLDYSSAHANLLGALRKAPQGAAAAGFIQACQKLNIVVNLLMGEIPERGIFKERILERSLTPYFEVVQSVRVGDLNKFTEALKEHASSFRKDGTYTLILRLRHNVIKTGIKSMTVSYSRISLRDICLKLHLDSEESAEYIVSKAIRDGVIDATIDHERGYMQSNEVMDVYSTKEPQSAFHERISFCMILHNESVKAMRYPMNAKSAEMESAETMREREKLAAEIVEDMEDDEEGDLGDF